MGVHLVGAAGFAEAAVIGAGAAALRAAPVAEPGQLAWAVTWQTRPAVAGRRGAPLVEDGRSRRAEAIEAFCGCKDGLGTSL